MFSQPCSLSLGHRIVAERIFTRKPRTLQEFQVLSKLSGPLLVVLALCHFARQKDGKSQAVLPITYLGIAHQPGPVHVNVSHSQPRQSLSNSGIKVWLIQRIEQHFRRVPPPSRPKIGEARIPERAQLRAEIALLRRNSHFYFLRSQWQRRRRQIQHFESLTYQSFRQGAMPFLQHRQIGLGDIKRKSGLFLGPILLQARLFQPVPIHRDPSPLNEFWVIITYIVIFCSRSLAFREKTGLMMTGCNAAELHMPGSASPF